MDVDTEPTPKSSFINYFDVSANFPWREPRPEQIQRRRALLGDVLIFDILLSSGGIRHSDALYPPHDEVSLKRLLDAIETSHYDALKKNCLVYFLLKWHQDGREANFQVERAIAPQFTALADAYWYLDSGINVPRAVSILSDARLNRDYASKILQAISLSSDAAPLIRKYIRTAQPPLTEPDDLDIYTLALAQSSILEAWKFQRTFIENGESRARLFRKILEWCVTPEPKPTSLKQLLVLPLSSYEQSLLNSYALEPPATLPRTSVAILQDLICVRLIQGGRYSDAIKIDRQFSSKLTQNVKQTHDRKQMIEDLYSALPAAERALLDAELSSSPPRSQPKSAAGASSKQNGDDISMSQPWEHVHKPEAPSSGNAPLGASTSAPFRDIPTPISERSGAPRFGGPVPSLNASTTPQRVPIIPITPSFTSGKVSTPRASFPLPTIPLSSSTSGPSNPRHSLSGAASRIIAGASPGVSSPVSGMRFSTSSAPKASTSAHRFNSAAKHANAFYQPPTPPVNGAKRPISLDEGATNVEEAFSSVPNVDISMEIDNHDNQDTEEHHAPIEGSGPELGFSVFNSASAHATSPPKSGRTVPMAKPRASMGNRALPGAFITDDDDRMGEDHEEEQEEQAQQSTGRSRSRQRDSVPAPGPASKPRTRRGAAKGSDRTLPGTLTDEHDEENAAEEEEDRVAPLRSGSPQRRPVRKARSLPSSDLGDEGEGITTRRRSSRLTHTTSVGGSPERSATSKTTRKSTRSGGARKKR